MTGSTGVALFEAFYRSGALVFGGGHVVLPLLREAFVTPGWSTDDAFLAGYGAAQAGIFLPGILILLGALPFWDSFRERAGAQAMMRGVNAALVGVLGAALYNPVWTTTVQSPRDFGIALVGFVLLVAWRAPPLVVVALSAAAGTAMALV